MIRAQGSRLPLRRRPRVSPAWVAAIASVGLWTAQSRAQSVERVKDQPSSGQGQEQVPEGDKDPLRGSIFTFEQSITTQTANIGFQTPQSYVPYYGIWMSLRPRWNFSDKLRVQARVDYYKELTNTEETTNRDEDVFGDIWTDLVYATPLATDGTWKNTKATLGARALWPTSKVSLDEGVYVTLGASGGLSEKFILWGPHAGAFHSARAGLTLTYLHPFSNSTTPYSSNFSYVRENVDGGSFVSHQISGKTLAENTLYGILDTGLDITPKLSATLDFIIINQWHYAPSAGTVPTATGPATPSNVVADQQYVQLSWILLSFDYEVIPEMSLGLGYYNLANTIAPDGTVRTLFGGGQDSLLWSADARFFFDVTANLDKIYEDASGKYRSEPGATAASARAARQNRLANELH